jgi:GntR family transcriptional regulator
LEQLVSIQRLAARQGLHTSMGELGVERRPPTAQERSAAGWQSVDHVLQIERVILAEDRPVAFLVDVVPEEQLPSGGLGRSFDGSVLDLFLQRGRPRLDYSRTEITAVAAPALIARRLRVPRGEVLLRLLADLYAADGRVVDRSTSYFLPVPFRFHVVRRVEPSLA